MLTLDSEYCFLYKLLFICPSAWHLFTINKVINSFHFELLHTVYNFINGKQVPSRGTKAHPIYNPATGEQIRQVIMSTPDDVNEAIEVAHKAFADWSATSPLRRARIMFKLKNCWKEFVL